MTPTGKPALLETYPEASRHLLSRTGSRDEATCILQKTIEYLDSADNQRFPKEVIDFFRTAKNGKTWWYNLEDLMAFFRLVKYQAR